MSDKPDGTGLIYDIVLRDVWSAIGASDKNFFDYAAALGIGTSAFLSYVVPAGKTLYITYLGVDVYATLIADRDLNQMVMAYLWNQTTLTVLARITGNGGVVSPFPKPVVIGAGEEFRAYVQNDTSHICEVGVTVMGYEI